VGLNNLDILLHTHIERQQLMNLKWVTYFIPPLNIPTSVPRAVTGLHQICEIVVTERVVAVPGDPHRRESYRNHRLRSK